MAVTRGEFARAIYSVMLGNKDMSFSSKSFSDIDKSSEYAGAVEFLSSAGIINGVNETEFKPMQYISIQDASVVIVRALGYDTLAQYYGGYPFGYLKIATDKKILNGIKVNGVLKRGVFAKLLCNMIDAEYYEVSSYIGEDVTYDKVKGILSQKHDIYKGKGKVLETSITGLYSPNTKLLFDEVKIGNDIFKIGDTKASGLLGMECNFYYKKTDGENILLTIQPSISTEQIILQNGTNGDIIDIKSSSISYIGDTGKLERISIEANASIIYNGKVFWSSKIVTLLQN